MDIEWDFDRAETRGELSLVEKHISPQLVFKRRTCL